LEESNLSYQVADKYYASYQGKKERKERKGLFQLKLGTSRITEANLKPRPFYRYRNGF